MSDIKRYSKLEHIENNPKNLKIDFDEFSQINIKAKEIYNCTLTGRFSNTKGIFHGNIVLCYLKNFISDNSDLGMVDWKDANFRDCEFLSSSFDYGAFINCHVSNCIFDNCHFKNVSITGTVFWETHFLNCDLSHMVIENCYFYNCKFEFCKTSNKMLEQCLCIDSIFNNTDIQLDTIIENLGIERKYLISSNIRDKSVDEQYKILTIENLQNLCSSDENDLQNIFKFRIEFFLKPEVVSEGSILFDSVFKVNEWLPLCKSQLTFLNMFKLFHDLLIVLFERNNLPLFAIYKFRELTQWLSEKSEIKNNFELYPAIIGYDVGLTRILSQANKLIEECYKVGTNKLILLVEGPLHKKYYYTVMKKFIKGNFQILKIVKQNSPNLIEIVAVAGVILQIIGLFITTRVKVELPKKEKKRKKSIKIKKREEFKSPYNLIEFEDKNNDILKMYFNQSTISHIIFSKHSTKDFGEMRKILINIIEYS
jgi:hypothetical protein